MFEKSSFALVIPCYNEEKVIPLFTAEISRFIAAFKLSFPQVKLSIIVVNNNSVDESKNLLERWQCTKAEARVIDCQTQGYGAALKCGFASAEADFYAFADLDNTYPLLELIPMFTLASQPQNGVDMVSGGRLNQLSQISLVRRMGNLFYSKIAKLIFFNCPITDTCSGMRIFTNQRKSSVLQLKENDLSFSIELTAHALKNGWQLAEHPIAYRDRIGASKLSVVSDGFKFLYILLVKKFSYAD